jgi:hypothetical protein
MREPINGIKIELNFAWHEAARMGRVPSWTDAGQNADTVEKITVTTKDMT